MSGEQRGGSCLSFPFGKTCFGQMVLFLPMQGYGSEREVDKTTTSAAAAANSSLIRRFNHHSTMVLKAADKHGTLQVQLPKLPSSKSGAGLGLGVDSPDAN